MAEPGATKEVFTYVVVYAALVFSHTEAHVKTMKEYSADPECSLGEFDHGAGLVYEIDALGPSQPLVAGC